jgi:hypothetical protein
VDVSGDAAARRGETRSSDVVDWEGEMRYYACWTEEMREDMSSHGYAYHSVSRLSSLWPGWSLGWKSLS